MSYNNFNSARKVYTITTVIDFHADTFESLKRPINCHFSLEDLFLHGLHVRLNV